MTQEQETILSKIRKLLTLAKDKAATPGEAAAAAARAQALLFEHKLSLVDVESKTGEKEAYGKEDTKLGGAKNMMKWRQTLMFAVARYNFCRAISLGSSGVMSLIGKPTDVEFVKWLYGYLVEEIDRLARLYATAHAAPNNREPMIRQFAVGAVGVIRQRLAEQRQKDEVATQQSTALVLVTDAAVKAAVAKWFPKLSSVAGAKAAVNSAFHAGRAAAQKMSLNRPLGSTPIRGRLS